MPADPVGGEYQHVPGPQGNNRSVQRWQLAVAQRATTAVIVVHHLEVPGNPLTGCNTAGDSELQHQGNHFVTVTVVPLPALETMSNSSMRRRTPGNPRPRPPELE